MFWAMSETLKMTDRGTVTLPRRLRKRYALEANALLIAEEKEDGILLRPATAQPIEIYSEARLREFRKAEEDLGKYYKRRP